MKPILYSFAMSSCSWRVRIALNFKEIDYEYKAVDFKNPKEKEEMLKITPLGQVPALLVDGNLLTQSISILEFLEETYPQKPLLPISTFDRAKVREICELITSGIQPLHHSSVVNKLKGNDPNEWKHYFNRRGLQALEKVLKECSGKYCVGDKVTLADCCLVPQVYASSIRFDVDLDEFPVISKIYSNLNILDPFIKAHAINQPDPISHYNEELKLK